MLVILRSALFNLAFYTFLPVSMILFAPVFLAPHSWAMASMRFWARSLAWLAKNICGIRTEVRGMEHIPQGAAIVASKHQSLWETYTLLYLVPEPAIILKRELSWIPVFGWWTIKLRMISVRRGGRARTIRALLDSAARCFADHRQIVIFPEGTRRPPGAPPHYKQGVGALYETMNVPCVPVALNSGLYWPRRKAIRWPGTIIVEFLPPIAPGLEKKEFLKRLQDVTEAACDRLIQEAAASPHPPPLARKLTAGQKPADSTLAGNSQS